jgi:hypothetical protein
MKSAPNTPKTPPIEFTDVQPPTNGSVICPEGHPDWVAALSNALPKPKYALTPCALACLTPDSKKRTRRGTMRIVNFGKINLRLYDFSFVLISPAIGKAA